MIGQLLHSPKMQEMLAAAHAAQAAAAASKNVRPGVMTSAELERFGPRQFETEINWMARIGRKEYQTLMDMYFPDGIYATNAYGFTYYERYGQMPPDFEALQAAPTISYESVFGPPTPEELEEVALTEYAPAPPAALPPGPTKGVVSAISKALPEVGPERFVETIAPTAEVALVPEKKPFPWTLALIGIGAYFIFEKYMK